MIKETIFVIDADTYEIKESEKNILCGLHRYPDKGFAHMKKIIELYNKMYKNEGWDNITIREDIAYDGGDGECISTAYGEKKNKKSLLYTIRMLGYELED